MNEQPAEQEEPKLPKGADYTIIVPLDKHNHTTATYHLKEMEEDVFMAAKALIDKGKDFDAVRMIIKTLHVGGDSPDLLKDNFVAIRAASRLVLEMMNPVEGEIKKN